MPFTIHELLRHYRSFVQGTSCKVNHSYKLFCIHIVNVGWLLVNVSIHRSCDKVQLSY